MIKYKTREEIELMRQSALLVSKTLGEVAKEVKPGVTALYLDKIAEEYIRDNGGIPGFLGLYDFPNTLCMSLNEQVVHGIPTAQPLENGDIISVTTFTNHDTNLIRKEVFEGNVGGTYTLSRKAVDTNYV